MRHSVCRSPRVSFGLRHSISVASLLVHWLRILLVYSIGWSLSPGHGEQSHFKGIYSQQRWQTDGNNREWNRSREIFLVAVKYTWWVVGSSLNIDRKLSHGHGVWIKAEVTYTLFANAISFYDSARWNFYSRIGLKRSPLNRKVA